MCSCCQGLNRAILKVQIKKIDHGIEGNISVSGLKRVPGGNIHQIKACDSQIEKNHVNKAGSVGKVLNLASEVAQLFRD